MTDDGRSPFASRTVWCQHRGASRPRPAAGGASTRVTLDQERLVEAGATLVAAAELRGASSVFRVVATRRLRD